MIEQLFGSKTRVKLLQLFYSNPNRSFYVREITRKIDEQINSVRRELANLLNVGIIVSDNTNNRLYYEVNQSYEYYDAFQTIFGQGGVKPLSGAAKSTDGLAAAAVLPVEEDDNLKAIGRLELLIYSGQFTRDEASGVDILVVGEINPNALQKHVSDLEAQENKALRYVVMTPDEFTYRRQINDRFITTLLDSKKQIVIDRIGI